MKERLTQAEVGPEAILDSQQEWFWEGNVQEAFCRWLRLEGWSIIQAVDTARKQRGTDIVAEREGIRAHLEVKGYPSKMYSDPRRRGEQKRTNPSLQAKHWFAHALLKVCQLREIHPHDRVGLVYPDIDRYRTLADSVATTLREIRLDLYFVSEDGLVDFVALA